MMTLIAVPRAENSRGTRAGPFQLLLEQNVAANEVFVKADGKGKVGFDNCSPHTCTSGFTQLGSGWPRSPSSRFSAAIVAILVRVATLALAM
jgi:hypothetical protein